MCCLFTYLFFIYIYSYMFCFSMHRCQHEKFNKESVKEERVVRNHFLSLSFSSALSCSPSIGCSLKEGFFDGHYSLPSRETLFNVRCVKLIS